MVPLQDAIETCDKKRYYDNTVFEKEKQNK